MSYYGVNARLDVALAYRVCLELNPIIDMIRHLKEEAFSKTRVLGLPGRWSLHRLSPRLVSFSAICFCQRDTHRRRALLLEEAINPRHPCAAFFINSSWGYCGLRRLKSRHWCYSATNGGNVLRRSIFWSLHVNFSAAQHITAQDGTGRKG